MRFFEPDKELLKSLVEYANGRVIIDIGCGDCDVLIALKELGAKVLGFEPFLFPENNEKVKNAGIMVIEDYVQRHNPIISGIKEKGLLLFARSCHSNFVEQCLDMKDKSTEALYITIPENLILYNDLGYHEYKAFKKELKGSSRDNEVIYSIR